MSRFRCFVLVLLTFFMVCTVSAEVPDSEQLKRQVEDTERAFALTMAERDHVAFTQFLSDEAIFFSGETALRGKQRVVDSWKPYFKDPEAPFSWEPQTVEVLDSGTLALSSGPVRDAAGNVVATFNSVWRLESHGQWQIIFDKGNRACADPGPVERE